MVIHVEQLFRYNVLLFQVPSPMFNKGQTMNVGFKEVTRLFQPDCYIFHDVDMIPEDDRHFYRCEDRPLHMGSHVDKFNYQ